MNNYDLSSPAAIAAAAEEVEKERLRLHEVGFQTGKYDKHETAFLYAYGQALKDCSKGLERQQRLLDKLLGYLGDNYDSRELHQILHENLGMSYDDIDFLGLDVGEPDELDGDIEVAAVEYARDFGNGYKIQMVFANQLSDGAYGDIYDLRQDVLREHPHDGILIGYCVVDTVEGIVPLGCNDWNNTVAEAIADYTDNVVPHLEIRDIEVHSWEDMQIKYPMGREEMSEEEEEAFVADCYRLYEKEGFSPRYWSPFTDNQERIGLPVEIVGRVDADTAHDLCSLPMWKARLNGEEFEVFPEEVVPSEMNANGCRWFDDALEYDRDMTERVTGLAVDVMSPQEMADATGKSVKDLSKYYLPKDIVPSVGDIIRNAEERTSHAVSVGKDRDLEID